MFPDEVRYMGVIKDRLGSLPTYGTKSYETYKEAHDAAEKLEKKHGVGERYNIKVIKV